MELKLNSIELKGFKSIDNDGQTIPINDRVTVMIGANGSGKSNIVSFFQMLRESMIGNLREFVVKKGYANTFLFRGSKNTDKITAILTGSANGNALQYSFDLIGDPTDNLALGRETLSALTPGKADERIIAEALFGKIPLLAIMEEGVDSEPAQLFSALLWKTRCYQFHDTTGTALIRKACYINDNRELRGDGGNLSSFLYGIKKREGGEKYYNRILLYIQQVMPQLDDFILEPREENDKYVTLDWKEKGADNIYGVHQLSDGTLRFIALAALLMQPPETLPSVIVIDEPELGLHPRAITVLASMIRQASHYAQVIVATQSPQLLDEFDEDNIVVVERDRWKHSTTVKKLDKNRLKAWLKRYTLSELWDKNVLGGRP